MMILVTTIVTVATFIMTIVRNIIGGLRDTIERLSKEAKEREDRSDSERLKTAEGVASLNATLIQFDKRLERVESERRR